MNVIEYENGLLIKSNLFEQEVFDYLKNKNIKSNLVLSDPPYNIIGDMFKWDKTNTLANDLVTLLKRLEDITNPGAACYSWGGYGSPENRPFFETILGAERETKWRMSSFMVWKKLRARGVPHRYLSTHELCAHFILGDIKKPAVFNVSYTDEKRSCRSFNSKFQCKSEYKRRGMVIEDVSDMQKKKHFCQKPGKLNSIFIEASSNPGDTVLDLFSGSGEASVQSVNLGRKFIAIEFDDKQFEIIKSRFDEEFGAGKDISDL
jgi:DNA modification methylase